MKLLQPFQFNWFIKIFKLNLYNILLQLLKYFYFGCLFFNGINNLSKIMQIKWSNMGLLIKCLLNKYKRSGNSIHLSPSLWFTFLFRQSIVLQGCIAPSKYTKNFRMNFKQTKTNFTTDIGGLSSFVMLW